MVDVVTPPLEAAASNGSKTGVLGNIAARRQQIAEEQVLTIPVPRWTKPALKIRFGPVPHPVLRKSQMSLASAADKIKDAKRLAQVELDVNADVLINACVEIIAVLEDGTETGVGPDGLRTRFDADLAIALDLPENATARATCRALFITEADLISTSRQLSEWSGYRDNSSDEELEGE